ncbi:hypothetical protein RhiirC2_784269 [Rhizophagus irregularis]|uniref:Lysozyme n=1 Tax=Rhizophagus irregularis TaxID=588596 RepID=A0A2N1MZ41_9GLOM|nr:hypothetical protein RhiirC2_784269 [Rhizophagus irregularis]
MRRAQHINKAGLKLIKKFEGFRTRFYVGKGIITIGYGHACHVYDCSKIHPPISRAKGEALLKKDLVVFEKCVDLLTQIKLNSNQFSALVSFTYNLCCEAYRRSTLRRKLNAGNTKGASKEFRRWVYADGSKLRGLVRRRKVEKEFYL